jgi:hypothetical protein
MIKNIERIGFTSVADETMQKVILVHVQKPMVH